VTQPEPVSSRQIEREWADIAFALKTYAALLVVQIVTALTAASSTHLAALIVADIALGVTTFTAIKLRWSIVRPSVVRSGFTWQLLGVVLGAAVPIFLAVHFVANGIAVAFSAVDRGYLADFRGVNVGWAYLIIAVNAAVLEELAFRGAIFSILRKYIGLSEAVIATSFAFAILHLSVLGLLTHVGLGVYFCWLRERSGTVYPCILAHFLHNTLVLLNEQMHVLSGGFIVPSN
jgi:membrane protease YdiL (CAAX protease family)